LKPGWESFVGAGPMPMRHGMTMGELGLWFIDQFKLDVDYRVVEMQGWAPEAGPGFGWPLLDRSWVNPSPNAPNLSMARAYAGTVMLEGATLSEGRGTTRPLELFGAPDLDARAVIAEMQALAPDWLGGCILRDMWFEPTFHKHVGKLCSGVQIHVDHPGYHHAAFKPWRVQALGFKAIRGLYPDYDLWRDFPYEYAFGKLPIDVINGGPGLREWVDDAGATPGDLDAATQPDEAAWDEARRPVLLDGSLPKVRHQGAIMSRSDCGGGLDWIDFCCCAADVSGAGRTERRSQSLGCAGGRGDRCRKGASGRPAAGDL
ncbi:MAG: exo-beta-N-acetylmuramidase NamZ domain-containing protein, partial [Ferrovibrio sp.]